MSWWRKLLAALGLLRASGAAPLCDTCRYDYGGACRRPERPNAYRCPEYKAR
jgi:hypothetical protein